MEDDEGRELWTSAQKGCITQLLPSHTGSPRWMLRAFLVALANDHVDTAAQLARAAPDLVKARLVNDMWVDTPLEHAASHGSFCATKLLLDLGALASCHALYWAVRGGHVPVVNLLASSGADVNEGGLQAPLHMAASLGDVHMTQALLERKADPAMKASNGWTPMYMASVHGQSAVVHLLVRSNASVNCTTDADKTPMHAAATYGHSGVLEILLDAKADAAAVDDEGRTPLANARERGHELSVQLLQSLP